MGFFWSGTRTLAQGYREGVTPAAWIEVDPDRGTAGAELLRCRPADFDVGSDRG